MPRQRCTEPPRHGGGPPRPPPWSRALPIAGLCLLLISIWALSCNMLDRQGTYEPGTLGAGGGGQACEENGDCPGLFAECQRPSCVNSICGTHYLAPGTSCTENEGAVCDGAGDCVECVDETQCTGGFVCDQNICVNAECVDGILNGDETDLDCGGSCAPCENGQFCSVAGDCISIFCASNGICAPCTGHADCPEDTYCCILGIQGCDPQDPADLDDLNNCLGKEDNGSECNDGVECVSGNCPGHDRVCCNSPCDGFCYACLDGKNDDAHGQGDCGPVATETDPDGECPHTEPTEDPRCQSDGRGCDGAGACVLWPDGTVCDPQHCSGGDTQNFEDTCDGAGVCENGGIDDCSPYICEGVACRTDCTGDGHCLSGSWCDPTGTCASIGNIGDPCNGDNECQQGNCEDNRCCENSCSGECMACSQSKTGLPNGECHSIDPSINADPDNECSNGACYRIDTANGECRVDQGQSCSANADCLNNRCRDNRCCNSDCGGECEACRADWSLGANGVCSAIDPANDPDPNDECTGGECFVLSATSGECRLYQGQSCGSGNDCLNGICVDGRCCNNICNGTCVACRADWTVGANGVCSAIDTGTDPDTPEDCTNGACYQLSATAGECRSDQGQWCVANDQCLNNQCRDNYCCNDNCAGDCRSCNASHTGGTNGICANALTADPQNDCTYSNPDTCGHTGDCASGDCEYWGPGVQCAARSCVGDTEYPPDGCSGSGTCVDSGSLSCEPYMCDGDHCRSSCTNSSHCFPSYYCEAPNCLPY